MALKKDKIRENNFSTCYSLAMDAKNLDNSRGNWRRINAYYGKGNAELDEFIQALIYDTCPVDDISVIIPNVDKLTLQFDNEDLNSDIILLAPENPQGYQGRTYSESTHVLLEAYKGYRALRDISTSKADLFKSMLN